MKKHTISLLLGVAISATATMTQASPAMNIGPIFSDIHAEFCMAVQGKIREGANVQLQKCGDLNNSDIHGIWYYHADNICLVSSEGHLFCMDYDGEAASSDQQKDVKLTKREPWKGNQIWMYESDGKWHGLHNMCLDVNAFEAGGKGQIKVDACENWKMNQRWSF